eukprot:8877187-Pyramimonas_sp.AAC.1
MAPWARWNRLYLQSPTKPTGVVLLLLTRVGGAKSTVWTAVDPTQRVVFVSVRDKKYALSKTKQGIVWTEHPGLNEKQRDAALIASERLIARSELKDAEARSEKVKAAELKRKKKPSSKTQTASWMFKGVSTLMVAGWSY